MQKYSRQIWILFVGIALSLCCQKEKIETIEGNLAIAPLPAKMRAGNGYFLMDEKIKILTNSKNFPHFDPFKVFNEAFEKKSGYALSFIHGKEALKDSSHLIKVTLAYNMENKEAYNLKVESSGILITAGTELGVFYALQTLRQIMRLDAVLDAADQHKHWSVPLVDIYDQPRFGYRGMHLDVSRHFLPVEFVKKYIDLLAYYKMNYFHWHLTDDQGWRIEIKKYPKLQEVGAWRDETLIGRFSDQPERYDGTRYGGFYTQDQIRDVVKYAADRAVTIIPEIEMPGHALAALAAYPQLGCTPGPYKVGTKWGVFDDVFCPSDSTFIFLENVLDEVLALFPSQFIHIGGDECPKTKWMESKFCQDLMKKEGLKNENELQSYFIERIEKYLNAKGKTIVGWDEILEGGLAPNAVVMSWRGFQGGIDAAKAGHNVIMTPGDYCYFDHYQSDPLEEPIAIGGFTSVEKVYSFDPIPTELTLGEAKHILGGQGNVWTEYMATPEKVEYMSYPRAIALAEVLWTPTERRSWPEFAKRLSQHLDRLDGMHVNYANHLNLPSVDIHSASDGLSLTWKSNLPGQIIYFTKDTSVAKWNVAKNLDKTKVSERSTIYYKGDHTAIRRIDYNPSEIKDATITSVPSPDEQYPGRNGALTLGDGLVGNMYFNGQDWCAWNGKSFDLNIDFPAEINLDSIKIGVLSSPEAWIYFPQSIDVTSSSDHQHYTSLMTWNSKALNSGRQEIVMKKPGSKVRYLRIHVIPVLHIPGGSPGAGNAAWAFLDEIAIF